MSDEAVKILDDLDWAEKVVRRKSTEAAEAEKALTEAMDERAKASRAVALMIRANRSSAISWHGGTYVLREHDIVERIPTVIVHDCAVPKAERQGEGDFLLRWWCLATETFFYVGQDDGREAAVDRLHAFHFESITQAERFRAERPQWSDYEVAHYDDPIGPPIDAEVEDDITPESLARALNPSDEEIDEAAGYAAVRGCLRRGRVMTWPTYSGRLELRSSGLLYGHRPLGEEWDLTCLGHIENAETSLRIKPSDEKDYRILLDVWLAEQRRRGRELAKEAER